MANSEKTLAELIEETIGEIDELRKSRFSAAEIDIHGPGEDGIAGKPANGELDAKKSEDEDEDDKEDKEDKDEAKKSEDEITKMEDKDDKDKDDKDKDDKDKDDKDKLFVKKSLDESEDLIKSYVDARICSLEDKLSGIADMVASIADQPVGRTGVPAGIQPLAKSVEEVAPLNKTELATELFELKKSGNKEVDSADIFRVETGSDYDRQTIATKYGLR